MPYLVFDLNDGNEFIFDLLEERLSLGRNPRNEIVIDNSQISSFHAEFARQPNGDYLLTDLKSSNGTYVNGRRVESVALKSGDRVRFGQLEARFREMHLPGPGREKKGPARSAEEKRRDAESAEEARSQTDFIPLEKTPIDAVAPMRARKAPAPDVLPLAPTSPPAGSCATIPKPAPTPLQIVARVPAPSAAKPATPPPQTTTQIVPAALTPLTARTPVPAPATITSAHEPQEELTALKAKIADAQAQLDKLRDDHSKELEKLSAGRAAMEKNHEIADLAEQGAAQHTLLQTLSKQRSGLEEVVATLGRTVEEANSRLARIESRAAELEKASAACRIELQSARAAVAQSEAELLSHRDETHAAAAAKERHLAEHEKVKSRLAIVTKLLEETTARHREAESHAIAAEGEARKHQTRLDALLATAAEKALSVASLDERHGMLSKAAASFEAEEASRRERLATLEKQLAENTSKLARVEASHSKAVHALQAAKDQAESLHAASSTLDMEVSAAKTALHDLVARRISEEERADLLAGIAGSRQQEIGEAERQLDGLMQQRAQGEEGLRQLRDDVANEQRRMDQMLRERAHEEEDRARALEKAGRDLEEAKHRAGEEAKLVEISLTTRLKERVRELEEKHEALRRSLQASIDEKTVILFANDIIKRIDLIDLLIQRVTGPGINGGMEQQLRTLRASFEDILEGHGIAEFKVAPGTEVDVGLRQQIAIVESVSGPARPRIIQSYRPGFIYSRGPGREVVLRKVEVKTSSE